MKNLFFLFAISIVLTAKVIAAMAENEWNRCEQVLSHLYKLRSEWREEHSMQLKATLCEVMSLSHTSRPPLSQNSTAHQHSPGTTLAGILAKLSCLSLENSAISGHTKASLLLCTAQFIWAVHTAAPDDADSSMPIADALSLAQTIHAAGLMERLKSAILELSPAGRPPPAPTAHSNSSQYMTEYCGASAVLLHLAYAIARMWPGGIMKSKEGAKLAASTAMLAEIVLRRLQYAEQELRREPVVAGTAVFSLHMVQQMHDSVGKLHTVAAGNTPCAVLLCSEGLLPLILLVLYAQRQQHQQQLEAAHPASSQQQQQQSQTADVKQQVEQYNAALSSLLGDEVMQLWLEQPCWRQHSSVDNLCTTLQLLEQVLLHWADIFKKQHAVRFRMSAQAAATAEVALRLPVVLLQLASSCSPQQQQQQQQLKFDMSAVSTITVAQRCFNAYVTGVDVCKDQQLLNVLPLQSLGLVRQLVRQHSSTDYGRSAANSAAAGLPAPAAATASNLFKQLLLLLCETWRFVNIYDIMCERHGGEVVHAMECCLRIGTAAAVAEPNGLFDRHGIFENCAVQRCAERISAEVDAMFMIKDGFISLQTAYRKAAAVLQKQAQAFFISIVKAFKPSSQFNLSFPLGLDSDLFAMVELLSDPLSTIKTTAVAVCLDQHRHSSTASNTVSDYILQPKLPWLLLLCRIARVRALQLRHTVSQMLQLQLHECSSSSSCAAACEARGAACRLLAALQGVNSSLSSVLKCWIVVTGVNGPRSRSGGGGVLDDLASQIICNSEQIRQLTEQLVDIHKHLVVCVDVANKMAAGLHVPQRPVKHASSSSSASNGASLSVKMLKAATNPGELLTVLQRYKPLHELPGQLVAAVDGLCALLPVSCCCNNPGCSNLSGHSELQLVGGKSCICAACKTARYCSRSCQQQHWKLHKPMCTHIRAAAAVQAEAAPKPPAETAAAAPGVADGAASTQSIDQLTAAAP